MRTCSTHRSVVPNLTVLFLVVLVVAALAATTPGELDAQEAPRPSPAASSPPDPLGRATPRGAMIGFLEASGSGDNARAADYLDLRRLRDETRAQEGPVLARQLRIVLDQVLAVDPDTLSDEPDGNTRDDLPADRELVGSIPTGKGSVPLLLQRIRGDGTQPIWRISGATVAQIPALYREFGFGPLGAWLPAPFFEVRFLDVALWQWIALMLLVAVALAVSWPAAVRVRGLLALLIGRTPTAVDDALLASLTGPLRLAIAVVLFAVGTTFLGLAIPARRFLANAETVLAIAIAAWVILKCADVFGNVAAAQLARRGRASAIAVVPLGRKAAKVAVVLLAFVAALQNIGFNVTGLLAGLGIGGLAVALAAQKTLENLFGGISLIVDQPVRVGDFCRFGDNVGTVEEIGLRSTRVRTLERTVVSIPNAQFSALTLENFAPRDRCWLRFTVGLRYETSPDQLRYVLVEVRKMLYAHPRVEREPARIRLVGLGTHSIDLEVFAYVPTANYDEFLAVREDIYLRIMDIVAEAGTAFAFPSHISYVARDRGLDAEKGHAAEARVREWRQTEALYMPEFPREVVSALGGTLDYPPKGAAAVSRS